jgi:multidrug efflux pump subunit AcrB
MIQPLSSASRFMIVGLSSESLSLIDMSVLARWTIAPRLMGVPGVAHVAIWGNQDRQLRCWSIRSNCRRRVSGWTR